MKIKIRLLVIYKKKVKKNNLKYKTAILSGDNIPWEEYKKVRNEENIYMYVYVIKNQKRTIFSQYHENKHNNKELWRNLKIAIPENNMKKKIEKSILFQNWEKKTKALLRNSICIL